MVLRRGIGIPGPWRCTAGVGVRIGRWKSVSVGIWASGGCCLGIGGVGGIWSGIFKEDEGFDGTVGSGGGNRWHGYIKI